MKRLFIAVMCMLAHCLHAIHSEEAFLQANKLYEQQEYAQAIELYGKVKNPGFAVLYNSALAYIKLDKPSEAVVELLKAEQCANFKQLTCMHKLLNCIQADQGLLQESWVLSVEKFFKKCILSYSMFLAQISLLLLLLILLGMVYTCVHKQRKGVFVSTIVLFLCSYGIWHYKMNYIDQKIGVVVTKSDLRVGPENTFYAKDIVDQGAIAAIVAQQHDFYKITVGKKVGWIASENVKLVS